MIKENDNERRIKEKVEFFMDEKVLVHVKLNDKTFLNGMITKKVREGVYKVDENKLGDVFLFLKEVYDIDEYLIGGGRM